MAFESPGRVFLVLWFVWCFLAALAWFNVYRFHRRERRYARRKRRPLEYTPFAVITIAIKGTDEHLRHLLDGMLTQQYPHYRIIFIVETKQDPTFDFLRRIVDSWAEAPPTEQVPLDTSVVRTADE